MPGFEFRLGGLGFPPVDGLLGGHVPAVHNLLDLVVLHQAEMVDIRPDVDVDQFAVKHAQLTIVVDRVQPNEDVYNVRDLVRGVPYRR